MATTTKPLDLSKHIRAYKTPVTIAAYNIMMSASLSLVDQASLKAVVTPYAGDWLHAPLLTAVGLQLSDEAIRVAIGYRLGTNIMSIPYRRMWCNGWRQRLHGMICCQTGPVTSATRSSVIWFGELSRRHRFQQAKNPSDCWGLTVNDLVELMLIFVKCLNSWRSRSSDMWLLWIRGKLRLGYDSPRYIRSVTPSADNNDSLRSSRKGSCQQINEVCRSSRHTFLHACHGRNKRCLVPTVGRIHWRIGKTDHRDFQRAARDNISVPEDVGNTTQRQCSRLSQHFPVS